MNKKTVKYEARLNRNIVRSPYNVKTVYKKGTVIYSCSEKAFNALSIKNISDKTDLSICEGNGVYEYFDLIKDIQFFRVEVTTNKKEILVKLK